MPESSLREGQTDYSPVKFKSEFKVANGTWTPDVAGLWVEIALGLGRYWRWLEPSSPDPKSPYARQHPDEQR